MVLRARYFILIFLMAAAVADGIDFTIKDNVLLRALREMTNQTTADTLNLPANASSIRENITDTFSCENRTYGYYADVDNECQVFHVCVPTQTPSGRNITYRYSFICPNETIFNQEVMTCTRPIDSIPCEESPSFYHMNDDIGKESNKTTEKEKKADSRKTQKRKEIKRKENIIMESFIKNVVKDELKEKLEQIELGMKKTGDKMPTLIETVIEDVEEMSSQEEKEREEDLDRMIMERNIREGRKMRRGSFKFKSDV